MINIWSKIVQSLVTSLDPANIRLACALTGDTYSIGCWCYLTHENARLYNLPYLRSPVILDVTEEGVEYGEGASGRANATTTAYIRDLYNKHFNT